jgi:hypothetical protein
MAFRLQENPTMWVQIRITAIGAAFLAGTAAVAYGQDGMTQNPGPIAPGNLPTDRPGPGSASPATGGYGTLGAGDTAAGNWTGTNSGVDRRQTGGYPGYGPGYSGSTVAPGGNGTLGAGDAAIGGWTGANPGIDRRSSGGYYYGPGLR